MSSLGERIKVAMKGKSKEYIPIDPPSPRNLNWEVCHRMLIHDLLDLSKEDLKLKKLLKFYSIEDTPWGTYSMALPRWYVLKKINLKVEDNVMPFKGKKKGKK